MTNKAADSGTKDALDIYLLPHHPFALSTKKGQGDRETLDKERRRLQLWARLLRIYLGTQPQPEIRCHSNWPPAIAPMDPGEYKDKPENAAAFHQYLTDVDRFLRMLEENVDSVINSEDDVTRTIACLRDWVELRTASVPYKKAGKDGQNSNNMDNYTQAVLANMANHAPLMRTFSALGILKGAAERTHPLIGFVTPAIYHDIVGHEWNKNDIDRLSYYTLLRAEEDSVDCPKERKNNGGCDNPVNPGPNDADAKALETVDNWIEISPAGPRDNYPGGLSVYEKKAEDCLKNSADNADKCDVLNDTYVKKNYWLGRLRRYVLIIVDDQLPAGPVYAPYRSDHDGKWYYIDGHDRISQKNFDLLSLFLTMMAAPPTTPPLTPSISVGGS